MISSYEEARDWLEKFIPYTYSKDSLGLERIEYLLKLLGNPQKKFKSILIAGTSGKGSVAFYLSRLLAQKKYKVGLHTKPHLVYLGERMQINGKPVSKTRLIALVKSIKPVVESMEASQVGFPSYFEIIVAITFLYFAQEKVDWAVVEVGLGGRLDATNVLAPKLCVITSIGLDHTEILGGTIEAIAHEKAGIIKGRAPVVTGVSGKAQQVIKKQAKAKKARLIIIDTLFGKILPKKAKNRYEKIYYDIVFTQKIYLTKSCFFLCIGTINTLKIKISQKNFVQSFLVPFPGRFEKISNGVIIDGAHNADKVSKLIEYLNFWTDVSSFNLVLAFKKGKDWQKMVDLLLKKLPVAKIYVTKFYSVIDMGKYVSVNPREISGYIKRKYKVRAKPVFNSQQAVFEALNNNQDSVTRNHILVITGSLYLAGEARTLWRLSNN